MSGNRAKALDLATVRSDDSPGYMHWRVNNAWQRAVRFALEPHGLTHVQFAVLAMLGWLEAQGDRPASQVWLAQRASLDPMMTSQVVRTLERARLLRRDVDPRDARARNLALTPAGRRRLAEAFPAVAAAEREFFAPLGTQRAGYVDALSRLDRDRLPKPGAAASRKETSR